MGNNRKTISYIEGCLKQAFSWRILILIIGVSSCICLDNGNTIALIWHKESSVMVYNYIMNSVIYAGSYIPYLAPVLAACGYASSYCREYDCGMSELFIGRMGCFPYSLAKIITSALYGGMIYSLGIALFVIVVGTKIPLYVKEWSSGEDCFPFYNFLAEDKVLTFYMVIFYLTFLSGILWSVVALTVSAYIRNIYVTVASPLLFSFLLGRIYVFLGVDEKYRLDLWLSGRSAMSSDSLSLLIESSIVLLILVGCSLLFIRKVKINFGGSRNEEAA